MPRSDYTILKELQQVLTDSRYVNFGELVPQGAKVSEDFLLQVGRLYNDHQAVQDIKHVLGMRGAQRRRRALPPVSVPEP